MLRHTTFLSPLSLRWEATTTIYTHAHTARRSQPALLLPGSIKALALNTKNILYWGVTN